jgi:hypothetical protein
MGGIALHGNFRVDAQDWGIYTCIAPWSEVLSRLPTAMTGLPFSGSAKTSLSRFPHVQRKPKAFGTAPFRTAPCACG